MQAVAAWRGAVSECSAWGTEQRSQQGAPQRAQCRLIAGKQSSNVWGGNWAAALPSTCAAAVGKAACRRTIGRGSQHTLREACSARCVSAEGQRDRAWRAVKDWSCEAHGADAASCSHCVRIADAASEAGSIFTELRKRCAQASSSCSRSFSTQQAS